MYALSMVQYQTCLKTQNQQKNFDKNQSNSPKQLKLEEAAIFLKNCQGEIMIDQNGLKNHQELMKCSFLENFEAFSLQLCYQSNSFTGVVPLFFVLLI